MRKLLLTEASLNSFFAEIAKNNELYIPQDGNDGKAAFKKWENGSKLSAALNTTKSPKDLFFPQTEDLMKFQTEGKNISIIDTRCEPKDFVVFGVRACDVRSFDILDRVFMSEPRDSYYASKREHCTIISSACSTPSETCFCTAFGLSPAEPKGDISTWQADGYLYLAANTDKGNVLLASLAHLTEECPDDAVTQTKEKINAIMKKLPNGNLSTDAFGAGKTEALFNAPEWNELSESCLGCGTCTFVCPTCQCYDIKDFNTGNGVIRYRCWDSCMYSEFTRMAHGNNRLTQKERFRQRFMHKLVYFPENNDGIFGCVGCGRCLAKCPISMNIVKVMKKLGGSHND